MKKMGGFWTDLTERGLMPTDDRAIILSGLGECSALHGV